MILSTAKKTALIFGASGLVGGHLLDFLIASANYTKIISFGRRTLNVQSPKLSQVICDKASLHTVVNLIKGEDLFIALGTTIADAGSKQAFKDIDCHYVVDIANAACLNHVNQCIVVSGMGASENSFFFYNRVKGEMESKLSELNFWALHIMRPSLLLGNRTDNRLGEQIGAIVGHKIKALTGDLFSKWTPIQAKVVSNAMIFTAQGTTAGIHIYLSDTIKEIGSIKTELSKK